jgi:hypothetical protein
MPIQGLRIGTARLTIGTFDKIAGIARSFGKSEAEVTIADGLLKIGSFRYRNEAITVGTIPDQTIDLPVNATAVDTLALAELLTADQIVQQGLHRRVQEAREVASEAISKATQALKPLDISLEQIQELVSERVRQVSESLANALAKEHGGA